MSETPESTPVSLPDKEKRILLRNPSVSVEPQESNGAFIFGYELLRDVFPICE